MKNKKTQIRRAWTYAIIIFLFMTVGITSSIIMKKFIREHLGEESVISEIPTIILGAFLICAVLVVIIGGRDLKISFKASRADETLKILGNLYYAMYRINFKDETYEIIKGSEYALNHLQMKGDYNTFLPVMMKVIAPKARREFEASFSCDNIRMLVENNIRNFGGDFQRSFDGIERWVTVRVMYDETIATNEVILVFKDTEREKQRSLNEIKLLEEALEVAKHSEKAKQDFFKNMSHDMRTPLNAIIGLSSIASENIGNDEKILEYLNSIKTSGQILLELVNEILDMSRIQDGALRLNYQQINIYDCINDCTAAFVDQAKLERKEFKIQYKIQNRIVMGDNLRICQIISNLLSNAFKCTVAGDTISLTVTQVKCENFSQYIIIVSDTGIGMSEDFLLHLFEPYTRETMFSANHVVGTGLGLPITKNIVSQMNGEISVGSTLGKGSKFTVTLPFVVVKQAEPTEDISEVKPYSLNGKKILLAEDNILNMEVASEILKMNGIEVTEVWNGEEALEAFKKSEIFYFDAILMDVQMPKMDGCEAARRIRRLNRPDAMNIPIIAVTANAFSEDIVATSAAGMNTHISKPIDTKALCNTLEKYLN